MKKWKKKICFQKRGARRTFWESRKSRGHGRVSRDFFVCYKKRIIILFVRVVGYNEQQEGSKEYANSGYAK